MSNRRCLRSTAAENEDSVVELAQTWLACRGQPLPGQPECPVRVPAAGLNETPQLCWSDPAGETQCIFGAASGALREGNY